MLLEDAAALAEFGHRGMGRLGSTNVLLASAEEAMVESAVLSRRLGATRPRSHF
jgi:hypothetical protein